jgi:FKBP-type peptidyl-prolyl cis-trans isomerase SlyD
MSTELTVEKDRVVLFHYTLRNADDAVLESTDGGQPQAVLFGQGGLIRGVEEALAGRAAGERFTVTLGPEQAFGERREDWTQRVSKKYLPRSARPRAGTVVRLQTDEGPRLVTVVKVGNKFLDVDLNHPYAGQTLTFDLAVVEVREATAEELSHGHAHGPGGHHHH